MNGVSSLWLTTCVWSEAAHSWELYSVLIAQKLVFTGNIHDLYPSHRDSVYEDVPLPPGIRDPDSTFSGMWDLMGLVLLLCVSVLIPLRTGFEIEVDPLSGMHKPFPSASLQVR